MTLRFLIIILVFSFSGIASSQSVRVTVYGGGNVQFVFNSIADYKSGILLNNWTTLGIDVDQGASVTAVGWSLSVSAQDSDGDGALTGSVVANTIPFADIQVSATPLDPCVSCNFLGSPFVNLVAQPASTVIVNSTNDPNCPCPPGTLTPLVAPTTRLNISYRAGVMPLGSMLGRQADNYSDDLLFDLLMF